MGLNWVVVLGWVAERPRPADDAGRACGLVVATRDGDEDGGQVERHAVVAAGRLAGEAAMLRVGQQVYVTGRVEKPANGDGRRVVVAADMWALEGEDVLEPAGDEHGGTHASPRPHQRRGHWRRAALGTRDEHLVWVRATTVGLDVPMASGVGQTARR